jgi:hypothetical protein
MVEIAHGSALLPGFPYSSFFFSLVPRADGGLAGGGPGGRRRPGAGRILGGEGRRIRGRRLRRIRGWGRGRSGSGRRVRPPPCWRKGREGDGATALEGHRMGAAGEPASTAPGNAGCAQKRRRGRWDAPPWGKEMHSGRCGDAGSSGLRRGQEKGEGR